MSSPSANRRRGRPARDSATASPARSTRSSQQLPSSPTRESQTTPRASRRLRGEAALASSPMFFQSSPSKGNSSAAETPDVRMDEASSSVGIPMDGETTPRGNRTAMRGMIQTLVDTISITHDYQTLLPSIISRPPALPALISAPISLAAMGCLLPPDQQVKVNLGTGGTVLMEVGFQPLAVAGSWTPMADQSLRTSFRRMPRSPT